MGVTKVGPPDKSDHPKKRGLLHSVSRFLYVMSGLAWVMQVFLYLPTRTSGRAIQELTKDDDPGAHYQRPPGIPEADLTDDQREAAVERIKREQAIRRARGE